MTLTKKPKRCIMIKFDICVYINHWYPLKYVHKLGEIIKFSAYTLLYKSVIRYTWINGLCYSVYTLFAWHMYLLIMYRIHYHFAPVQVYIHFNEGSEEVIPFTVLQDVPLLYLSVFYYRKTYALICNWACKPGLCIRRRSGTHVIPPLARSE